jgi:hypothetical protein
MGVLGGVPPKIETKSILFFQMMVTIEITIGKLTFRLIEFHQLIYQHHYIIRAVDGIHPCYVGGRFLESFPKNPRFTQIHPNGSGYFDPIYARFFIKDIYGEKRGLRSFSSRDYYYELVSKKAVAQEAMEKRALQMILQNIIGDNCFTY